MSRTHLISAREAPKCHHRRSFLFLLPSRLFHYCLTVFMTLLEKKKIPALSSVASHALILFVSIYLPSQFLISCLCTFLEFSVFFNFIDSLFCLSNFSKHLIEENFGSCLFSATIKLSLLYLQLPPLCILGTVIVGAMVDEAKVCAFWQSHFFLALNYISAIYCCYLQFTVICI